MHISETIEEIIVPYIPILLIGINTKFKISLIIPPIAKATTGTFTFPRPCSAPFIVCVKTIKIIVKEDNCSIFAPFDALGNNI